MICGDHFGRSSASGKIVQLALPMSRQRQRARAGTVTSDNGPIFGSRRSSQIRSLVRRAFSTDFVRRGSDPEPGGIKRRKKQQDQHRARRRAANQRIGHRSPEDGVCEGYEGKHGGKRGQDHRSRALYRGLDDGVIVVEPGGAVLLDLFGQD